MEAVKSYLDLDVWKKSRLLTKEIYNATKTFPKDELYGLTNQIRRSAVSVPSNIAEANGRHTSNETIQFLYISRGSLYELETQLFISSDLDYISDTQLKVFLGLTEECKKLLNGFINYYKNHKNTNN